MVSAYTISVILFFITLAILLYVDRKKLEIKKIPGTPIPILFMRKTRRFRSGIDKLARISPLFWKALASFGVVTCFVFMLFGLYFLLITAQAISTGLITKPALQFILPSFTAVAEEGPGYILIPFWFWLITIAIILIPHELMHGVIARAEKIKVKSVGLLLLAIFPGAFVEPDERHLKRAKFWTKLRIFAAGSFANFLVAALVFSATTAFIWPQFLADGILITSVEEGSPAFLTGIAEGAIITEADGKPLKASYSEYMGRKGYFIEEIGEKNPGSTLKLKSDDKTYTTILAERNGQAHLGINYKPIFKIEEASFLQIVNLLTMVWLFSLAIGIVNILPIYPLDGGLLFEAIASKFAKSHSRQLVSFMTFVILGLLIFSFVGPVLIGA